MPLGQSPSRPGRPQPAAGRLPQTVGLLFLAILAASYVINAMHRQVFPVLLPAVDRAFHFTLPQGGLLSTIFTSEWA